jgi:hypothetical protein
LKRRRRGERRSVTGDNKIIIIIIIIIIPIYYLYSIHVKNIEEGRGLLKSEVTYRAEIL